ncbi:MAG: tetratricopeptide repeat protein [candidate division WOR-3 bacterium]
MRNILIVGILFVGCSTIFKKGEKVNVVIPEESFKAGKELFEKGKYRDAINKFKEVLYVKGFGPLANESQYYIAESYLKMGDYDQAILEFRTLVESYTGLSDSLRAKAFLGLAEAYNKKHKNLYLDVSEIDNGIYYAQRVKEMGIFTEKADSILKEINYKKATKLLLEADVYYKLKILRSWKLYLEEFLKLYPDDPRVDSVRALLGEK